MKKSFYFLFAFTAAFMVFSCVKSEMAVNDEISSETTFRTITLQFPSNPEAKVSMAEDGKTAWQAGDQILIHGQKMGNSGEEYYSRVVTLSAGDIKNEGKTATFTIGDIVADKSWARTGYKATLFAAYPASSIKSVASGTSWYYSTGFDQTQALLLGGCNDTSVNDGNTFTFVNLTGVLSFVVNGDFDSYIFTGNGGETVDYEIFAVRVDTESIWGDKNAIPYTGSSGIKCSGEKTSLSGSVVADGSTVNYLYFPGGVNLTSGFTIKFLKGGVEQKRVSTSTGKIIAQGKYLKLGNISDYLYTYTPPATHDSSIGCPADNSVYDLSKDASANCYIVDGSNDDYKDKVFKFKAYKGNSTASVGTINSVSILWETWNNAETVTENSVIAAVDYDKQSENEYYEICFKMPNPDAPAHLQPGNAVIVAKDALDKILWSWHIWVPQTSVGSGKYGFSSTIKMHDRNLGALVVADKDVANSQSSGMFYQWGRKDPFRAVGSMTGEATLAKTYPVSIWTTASKQASLEDAVQNPAIMYIGSYIWTSASVTGLWDTDKTINDPCPPGYKVPQYESTEFFEYVTPASYDAWEIGDYGFVAGTSAQGSTAFPFSGFSYYSSGYFDLFGTATRLWTAKIYNADPSTGTSRALEIKKDGSPSCTGQRMANACAVRCITE